MPEPREAAISIIRTLRDAGHQALLAGGCVRDELLGQHPKDFDVATSATPEQVQKCFKNTREVGKAFGVMQVRVNKTTVEVATFRTESGYSDNRRPDSVEFCDAETDAQRRDFTINALFIDPLDTAESPTGRVIDYVGGLADIEARTIRAVGDADARLEEDDLRALRAVRFSARLGFDIEPETRAAIIRHAGDLPGISRERIGDEMRRMLAHPSRARAASLIHELALDGPILSAGAMPSAPCPALAALPAQADAELGLAAWAIDRHAHDQPGVPPTRWSGGGVGGAATRYRRALMLSNDESLRFRQAIETLELLAAPDPALESRPVAAQKRTLAHPSAPDALALLDATDQARSAAVIALRDHLASTPSGLSPAPILDGSHLIEMGLSPGPQFKNLLEAAYDAQLEDRISTLQDAIALAKSLASKSA